MMHQTQVAMDVRKVRAAVCAIDIQGNLTSLAEHVLMDAYSRATSEGAHVIILNLNAVDYMNSSGIGLLVTLLIRINRNKQRLLTWGLNDHYKHIFEITRLTDAIGIYDSETEALAAVQGV